MFSTGKSAECEFLSWLFGLQQPSLQNDITFTYMELYRQLWAIFERRIYSYKIIYCINKKRWLRESMMLFEDRVFKQGVFKLKISPNVSFLTCFFGLHQPSFPWKGVKLLFYISNLNQNHQNFTNFRLRQALTCKVR